MPRQTGSQNSSRFPKDPKPDRIRFCCPSYPQPPKRTIAPTPAFLGLSDRPTQCFISQCIARDFHKFHMRQPYFSHYGGVLADPEIVVDRSWPFSPRCNGQEYEDWDEYEEDGEEQEVEEDDYEETYQPTQEALKYLEHRQKLKESFRKRMKKELGTASVGARDKINGFRKDNYGNFFGPSQPVISARVIQESKSLLENPDLAARISKPNRPINKSSVSDPVKSKSRDIHPPRVTNGLKRKAECLKNTRDYSFLLSDDYEVPATSKSLPPPRNVSASKTDARSAQQPPSSSNNNRQVVNNRDRGRESASNGHQRVRGWESASNSHHRDRGRESVSNSHHLDRERESASNGNHRDVRKPMPPSNQNKQRSGQDRVAPSRSKSSTEPRKQLGSNHGSGPGRPMGPKGLVPSRTCVPGSNGKVNPSVAKASASGANRLAPSSMQSALRRPAPSLSQTSSHKPIPSRGGQPSGLRKPLMQKDYRESTNRPKVVPKQAVPSSRDQLKRPPPKPAARHSLSEERPQAKPRRPLRDEASDDENAISMIRQMFRYDPMRFKDDDDVSDMEANFEDIMREEKRSAKIARQEDEEQMRLIEEEEKRDRMRQAKKRKMGH